MVGRARGRRVTRGVPSGAQKGVHDRGADLKERLKGHLKRRLEGAL